MSDPDDDSYPDMNAIRDAQNKPRPNAVFTSGSVLVDAFRAGMKVDHAMWHDGTGYKLDLLNGASAAEKVMIEQLLVPPSGWRDVEALAALDTDTARAALHKALQSTNTEVRAAVISHAPSVASDAERSETMLRALNHGQFFDDLSSVLDQVEEFHPPEIVNALFRGLLVRPGEIATNYAAMLAFVHGRAESTFDWDLRPLFLKFNTDDGAERTQAFEELCALLDLDPAEVTTRMKQ
ncbi:MAG: hypothetical protein ABI120_02925 [Gemmatimonadaceae bacterium]